jgi:hypothetical protein
MPKEEYLFSEPLLTCNIKSSVMKRENVNEESVSIENNTP